MLQVVRVGETEKSASSETLRKGGTGKAGPGFGEVNTQTGHGGGGASTVLHRPRIAL